MVMFNVKVKLCHLCIMNMHGHANLVLTPGPALRLMVLCTCHFVPIRTLGFCFMTNKRMYIINVSNHLNHAQITNINTYAPNLENIKIILILALKPSAYNN